MKDTASTQYFLSYALIIKLVLINILVWLSVYVLYGLCAPHALLPDAASLIRYDAIHYFEIKNNGYSFSPFKQSNVAFFPGFPYLWKFTGLTPFGISILNIILFLLGFVLLGRYFAKKPEELLLCLALPPLMFMYIPYSEALFFFVSSFLLVGLLKRNTIMIVVSLFLCSICRSVAAIFLPAIIIMEIMASDNPSRIKNIILYALSSLAGIFLVAWLQYSQTGQWMGFMTTQQYWEVKLGLPKLPLHTWGNMDYLDGASLLAGLAAIGITLRFMLLFMRKKIRVSDKAYLFSLLYISGLTFFTLAFKGGSLFSLNRYLVPTAFFFVALVYSIPLFRFTNKQLIIILLSIYAFWLLFYSFVHIKVVLGYLGLTLYLGLYLLLNNASPNVRKISFYALYVLNILIQVHFLYKFLDGKWIG